MSELLVWSGWVGGIAVGLYTLLQFWVTGKALGCSTGYGNVCGLASKAPFFHTGEYADLLNWRLWFLLGLPFGGAFALVSSGVAWHPTFDMGAMYEQVLPITVWARGLVLIAGGALIGYGARSACGCPSGRSIAGMSQLSLPSLLASVGFFAGGIIAVQTLFRVVG